MSVITPEAIIAKCAADPWIRMVEYAGSKVIKFGEVPEWFMDLSQKMPKGSPDREAHVMAAEKARQIYAEQMRVAFDPVTLDVKALCAAEPWINQPIDRLDDSVIYGFVTEKLERAVALSPSGTEERRFYKQAYAEAIEIYFNQIRADAWSAAQGRSRESVEHICAAVWDRAQRHEYQKTYVHARLVKVQELMGHYFRQNNPDQAPHRGGQRFVLRTGFSSGPE